MTSVALVHDILAAKAGGERVLTALADAYPNAPITTLIHEPAATFGDFDHDRVRTSWLNRSPWLRRNYRYAVPAAGLTYAATSIDAEVTICSTSGLSHHVRTTGAKIVYCHTPARWLHDPEAYLHGFGTPVRMAAHVARPAFTHLDRWAMKSADHVLANSTQVAAEIANIYGVDATVVSPCSTLDLEGPVQPVIGIEPGFVLSPARPLGYKRLDLLVAAARELPERTFLHVGEGPHRSSLVADAPANFVSVGAVSDAELRWAYRNATVVALTCAEDFGLVPLEAAAHGVHTVAPHARGLLDHEQSHLFTYEFASVESLIRAIEAAPEPTAGLHPDRLGQERFVQQLNTVVNLVA